MAEYALSYVLTLVVIVNAGIMVGLVAIVAFMPRAARRRPAHRAQTARFTTRLPLALNRSTPTASASSPGVRAARAA